MRALVIDDEQLVLEGLEAFLQVSLPDLSLDKTAELGTALHLVSSVRYELVLLDWNLVAPGGQAIDGHGVVDALRRSGSTAPIIIISGEVRDNWPQLLIELGLSGFVPKSAPGATLLDAIHVALRGGLYLPGNLLDQMVKRPYRKSSAPPGEVDLHKLFPTLTDRQVDVFRLMIPGLSNKHIARELGIAESTVKSHVQAILTTVGVERRGEAVHEVTRPGVSK